eukprot:CAMPEP_0180717776 /NCGR_PEP_ID=MMETSP1038_2-20121128/14150_1 /TAXON_ID=632150 /ORGANISM="Azadinium spinosum, Strain 3D9" /LENGTH=55 /DNA_ID=CAMNT_0022750259 /DNA_START=295 /DNA_END=462 /DNA_ORIENTATION=+
MRSEQHETEDAGTKGCEGDEGFPPDLAWRQRGILNLASQDLLHIFVRHADINAYH